MNLGKLLMTVAVAGSPLYAMAGAEDWPTYQKDNMRSGVTSEHIALPLCEVWVHESLHPPQPAWPEPAERDIWNRVSGLHPNVTYDRAFHTVVVGNRVYFGSSADDQVYCLDAGTGKVVWRFFTEGPVRLAPAVDKGKVYVGSDDGWAYCLNAEDGKLIWRYRADEEAHRIPGNGRVVSSTPLRTGILVREGIAYFFAGIFPSQGVFRCALNASNGAVVWHDQERSISPQGYLLGSPERLFVPTGRTSPTQFDFDKGRQLGPLKTHGGAYAVVTEDMLVNGPGIRTSGLVELADVATRETVATFDGLRMIVHNGTAYLQSKHEISAIDYGRQVEIGRERCEAVRELDSIKERCKGLERTNSEYEKLVERIAEHQARVKQLDAEAGDCRRWTVPSMTPFTMVLAGETLFAGGDGYVTAFSTSDGRELWAGTVRGKAYGLTVANGALLVSTDAGMIHCFRHERIERAHVTRKQVIEYPFPEDALAPLYRRAAECIIEAMATDDAGQALGKGYCLVLDCGEGRLAYELARRTSMQIVGVEPDADKAAVARAALDQAGLYGVRVAVHHGDASSLPYTSWFANVVTSDATVVEGRLPASVAEIERVLRPCGGLAIVGQPEGSIARGVLSEKALRSWAKAWDLQQVDGLWAMYRKPKVPGSGEWTQLYADASHTACSRDPLDGPVRIQWFGEPGPRKMIDRHHRPMSSLFKNGRVFIPGDDRVIAVDPYNGAALWELDVPNSRRVGALRNCGHM
ncbi:MAG TPA: methyltransferase domain-containing protein, partial [Candidatus Hydrogenedentes bacterium]|nr:methyltransferase domain-containing protein [Candidatus Hydrogenedentota bacterium]